VRLSPLGTAANSGLLYQPQMVGEGDCGAIGGMKIGRGNRSTQRKPAPSATLSTTNLDNMFPRNVGTFFELHGVTTQNTALFLVVSVSISITYYSK
jgi:hypothetical protein